MHDFLNDWITRARWIATTADVVSTLEDAAAELRREINDAGVPRDALDGAQDVATGAQNAMAFQQRTGAGFSAYRKS